MTDEMDRTVLVFGEGEKAKRKKYVSDAKRQGSEVGDQVLSMIYSASCEMGHPPILQLKGQFLRPHNFLNPTLNHIFKTSIES